MQGPIVTSIRALLTPDPMKELRVKHKEIKAAQGIKINDQKQTEPRTKEFSPLGWWHENEMQFPVLFAMARDLLNVPISTVARRVHLAKQDNNLETPVTHWEAMLWRFWYVSEIGLDRKEEIKDV